MPTASTQVVTEDLRQWIVSQAEAGCRPEDVLKAMSNAGWDEDVAVQAMEQVLRERLDQVGANRAVQPMPQGQGHAHTQGAAQPASAGQGAAQEGEEAVLPPSVKVPVVAFTDSTSPVLDLHDRRVQVLTTLEHPAVVVLGGFLSDEECDALMKQAAPKLARSETVETKSGGSEVNAARTSDGMFFERGQSEVIKAIEARIARMLDWPVENGEGLQILRYRPGAQYKPHHDYFDPVHSGTPTILKRGGQRVATMVMYLNTPEGGGATTFPDVGLTVAPIKGNAVFFSYDKAHVSTKTLHGGAPVTAGEKWVATKWLREGEFH